MKGRSERKENYKKGMKIRNQNERTKDTERRKEGGEREREREREGRKPTVKTITDDCLQDQEP
jgi:hypothetical protein